MTSTLSKQYTSALCIVPPRRLWDSLQAARCFSDRNFVRQATLIRNVQFLGLHQFVQYSKNCTRSSSLHSWLWILTCDVYVCLRCLSLGAVKAVTSNDLSRWPPHINLLYPFVGDKKGDLKEAAHLVSEELSKIQPFEVL